MLPLRSGILAETIKTMHLVPNSKMEKEIHYVLTIRPITKVISTGNLKTVLIFTSLTHADVN